jgi:hypothetical protein
MKAKAAADVEYPAYGVTGPNKEISPTGDRRLAQSAQMYHYQHQKQQIIAMERYVCTSEVRVTHFCRILLALANGRSDCDSCGGPLIIIAEQNTTNLLIY